MSELKIGEIGNLVSLNTISTPKWVGGYDINGTNGGFGSCIIRRQSKPNIFHRLCCRFFLGWKWIDQIQ